MNNRSFLLMIPRSWPLVTCCCQPPFCPMCKLVVCVHGLFVGIACLQRGGWRNGADCRWFGRWTTLKMTAMKYVNEIVHQLYCHPSFHWSQCSRTSSSRECHLYQTGSHACLMFVGLYRLCISEVSCSRPELHHEKAQQETVRRNWQRNCFLPSQNWPI